MCACDCVERISSNALQIPSKREFDAWQKGSAHCTIRICKLFQSIFNALLFLILLTLIIISHFIQCALFVCAFFPVFSLVFFLSKVVLEHHTVHYSLCSVGMYGVRWSSSLSWRRCLHECCLSLSLFFSFSSSMCMCLCVCMPMMKCMSEFNEQRNVSVKLMHTHIQNSCHSVQRLWIQVRCVEELSGALVCIKGNKKHIFMLLSQSLLVYSLVRFWLIAMCVCNVHVHIHGCILC